MAGLVVRAVEQRHEAGLLSERHRARQHDRVGPQVTVAPVHLGREVGGARREELSLEARVLGLQVEPQPLDARHEVAPAQQRLERLGAP
eukprot:scaffold41520_cov61-Phaeocystis_antarctica.AAC.3